MKNYFALFAALLTYGTSAQAVFDPNVQKTPIYDCASESVQTRVYKETSGGNSMTIQQVPVETGSQVLVDTKVVQNSGKAYMIFSSNDVVLKMSNHPSGFMPATLMVNHGDEIEKIDMDCQVVFTVLNVSAEM